MPPYTSVTTTTIRPDVLETKQPIVETNDKFNKEENDVPSWYLTDYKNSYKTLWGTFETPLIWTNVIGIFLIHFLVVFNSFLYDWTDGWKLILWDIFLGSLGGFGVTAGAHRYWCHRTFKAKIPLRIIMMVCYMSAGQNTLFEWVRDHRVHHKFSETKSDPHDSNRGFFFAHVGWLMCKKRPEVLQKGKQLDFSDLYEDPVFVFQERYSIILRLMFCFIIPTVLPHLLWNESLYWSFMAMLVRYVCNLNFTWLVNSAAHIWGNRPFDKRIRPVENLAVSIVAMGEGWHNYHHTFPWDYRASELGKINVTTFYIDLFAKIGWAYDLKHPSPELVENIVKKHGDGSHLLYGHTEVPETDDQNFKEKER